MKKNEVFIVRGWAESEGIDLLLTVSYPDGEKLIEIDTYGQNDAGDMTVIVNRSGGGQLFIGTSGDPEGFVLDIKPLVGDVASLFLEWAVADAQSAFRGEYDTQRLTAARIVFTASDGGYDITMEAPDAPTGTDTADKLPVTAPDITSDSLTQDDIKGDTEKDYEILSHYGNTSAVSDAKALLSAGKKSEAEEIIADMITSSFSDMIKYRTEI